MSKNSTTTTKATSEKQKLAKLSDSVRKIIGKGHHLGSECTSLGRNLTVNAVPGNGSFANIAVLTVAGTPTRGAVCVSLTHELDSISANVVTGKRLSKTEVTVLRQFICCISKRAELSSLPGTFAWESGVLYADGTQMHPGTDTSNK